MNKMHRSIVALTLALIGLVGCDYETRQRGDANPARVAEMQQTLRDLWVGHIFWVRHVVCTPGGNLADDAATHLCYCGYTDHGVGEAVSGQVFMTGA